MPQRTLSNDDIKALANMVAEDLGVDKIDIEALDLGKLKNHVVKSSSIRLPNLLWRGDYQIWIDVFYLAYSKLNENIVHYVYISPYHAKEELACIKSRISKATSDKEKTFLLDIQRQMRSVLDSGKSYYIHQHYRNRLEEVG